MQQNRKTLSVRVSPEIEQSGAADTSAELIRNAIKRKTCLASIYNRTAVELAPHILYTRHGDLFVDAVVVQRDGKPPKEQKLGTFKLAGLSAVSLTMRSFAPQPVVDQADPKYADGALCVVQA